MQGILSEDTGCVKSSPLFVHPIYFFFLIESLEWGFQNWFKVWDASFPFLPNGTHVFILWSDTCGISFTRERWSVAHAWVLGIISEASAMAFKGESSYSLASNVHVAAISAESTKLCLCVAEVVTCSVQKNPLISVRIWRWIEPASFWNIVNLHMSNSLNSVALNQKL